MIGERLGSMALALMLLIGGVLMHIWIGKLSAPYLGGTRITSPDQDQIEAAEHRMTTDEPGQARKREQGENKAMKTTRLNRDKSQRRRASTPPVRASSETRSNQTSSDRSSSPSTTGSHASSPPSAGAPSASAGSAGGSAGDGSPGDGSHGDGGSTDDGDGGPIEDGGGGGGSGSGDGGGGGGGA
jgi:hypothetical protein